MWNTSYLLLSVLLAFSYSPCFGQDENASDPYSYKEGDRDGIGKWYMGREIAHVMGFQGMRWLERPEREKEENTSTLIQNMDIQPSDTIADIGAGSGYHVFKMAGVATRGHVYAVDIQDEMLAAINEKQENLGFQNISTIKGGEQTVNLANNSVDKILMVDVYHEFNFPIEMIVSVYKALRKNGKLFLIEYRGEDDDVPIKLLHKMTEKQAVKEMNSVGFTLERNIDNLPWQHCMVFVKK